jgi:hypothetical protein
MAPDHGADEREVLGRELVLEGMGSGGDDAAEPRQGQWQGRREGLAGPGRGLDHDRPALGQDIGHCQGHLFLGGPRLASAVEERPGAAQRGDRRRGELVGTQHRGARLAEGDRGAHVAGERRFLRALPSSARAAERVGGAAGGPRAGKGIR